MFIIPASDYISCFFSKNPKKESESVLTETEVFFAETENLGSWFSYLKNNITNDEQQRADRFYSDKDNNTYIACHGLLRLILSARLNIEPSNITFIKETGDKPGMLSNQAFFNISHTREAFAIAFNRDFSVGIDLEKVKQNTNIQSITEGYFSKKEQKYIYSSKEESLNRFILLWTRKEALLKAIGTGIIENLTQVNVSESINYLKRKSFNKLVNESVLNEFYIYSHSLIDYLLSIAIPYKSSITLYNLNEENFSAFI